MAAYRLADIRYKQGKRSNYPMATRGLCAYLVHYKQRRQSTHRFIFVCPGRECESIYHVWQTFYDASVLQHPIYVMVAISIVISWPSSSTSQYNGALIGPEISQPALPPLARYGVCSGNNNQSLLSIQFVKRFTDCPAKAHSSGYFLAIDRHEQ